MMTYEWPFDMQFTSYKTEDLIAMSNSTRELNGFDRADLLNLIEELALRLGKVADGRERFHQ